MKTKMMTKMQMALKIAALNCIILLNLAASVNTGATQFSIMRQYSISDGISDNSVRSIIQDETGFVWLGTKDGINRFNGREFKRYGGYPRTTDGYLLNVLKLCQHSDGHRIWVGAVDGLYLFDDRTGEFSHFVKQSSSGRHIRNLVNDLCYDDSGRLWIATSTGLFRFDEKEGLLVDYYHSDEKGSIPDNVALALMKDASGDIWVGTTCGLSQYNKGLDKFANYLWDRHSHSDYPYEISQIIETGEGEIFIGTRYDGLLVFDRLSGKFTSYRVSANEVENTWVRTVHEWNGSSILIGSEDGIFIFDRQTREVKFLDSFRPEAVYSFITDHEGGIWIGTYFDGAYYISPQNSNVKWYHEGQGKNSLSGKAISQFCEDENGNIWVATEDEGLNLFNTRTGTFKNFAPPQISHNNIHALMKNGTDLWIGTFSQGINILDTRTGKVRKNYMHDDSDPSSLYNDHVYTIYRTSKGEIFIGTMRGLCRYVPEDDSFMTYDSMKEIFVYDMVEDSRGDIWIASKNDGVWRFDGKDFIIYTNNPSDRTSIGSNHIVRVHIDRNDDIWFATEGCGISRYDYESNTFINYDYTKGLYHHIIYGILDDEEGNLWLSSNYGIVKYNPSTHDSWIYTHEDGLQSNQFNYRSSMKASDGRFYFGGTNGFNSFYPDRFHQNKVKPQVVFSDITVHDSRSGSVKLSAEGKDKITIQPKTTSFEISFDCLSFVSPSKNKYAYMVDRLHDNWIYTDKPSVTFIDLPAGHYSLMVKAANNDGEWSEANEMGMFIKPSFWQSPWTITGFILITLLFCILITRAYIQYINKESDREKQRMEMEMQQEIYRSKFQFFTHIAHEIKTPLSLIKAPLEVILGENRWSNDTHENLLVIQQNTDRLMELIRQLLNFQKIDKEGYKINYSILKVGSFMKGIIRRFSLSDRKISIETDISEQETEFCSDSEAITKIMSNLLTNGLKYAGSKISVKAAVHEDDGVRRMSICIEDDGPGVSDNEREKIFEPFYRSGNTNTENGFGIGLSLVKLLIDKLGGTISVCNSESLGGLKAEISIPEGNLAECSGEAVESKPEEMAAETAEKESKVKQESILIVDDTKEVLDFLIKNLNSRFKLYGALNGKEAMEILENHGIDLIVSDIVMPEMDGFELLHAVRSDKMLCHIPFILLSAQANVNSKIAGLDYGADAYIEKPFSINHIKATIDNLLKNRKVLFERFASMPTLDYGKVDIQNHDIQWLEQVTEIIKNNLTNDSFNVDVLATEMALSRSSLRRKILGVTGLAPNDYIRLVRLKIAAQLMQERKYRVNEIAYLVGFSNHSYFARCFQKQFGVLPKDYLKDK